MSFESALADLIDPAKRPASRQLVDFSNLDAAEATELSAVWHEIDTARQVSLLTHLADLAQDNVELNFDAVFKVGLTDDIPEVRLAALHGLVEYEARDIIGTLSLMLREDPETEVRREAAITLGRYAIGAELGNYYYGDTESIREVLTESAEDLLEDERVRSRAIEALGALSGEETDNLIESIYGEDSLWMKVGAVDAMGRSSNDVWLPTLLRELTNRAPEMRHAAAFALGEIGEPEAIEPLKRAAIEDPDREVQMVAIRGISEIGGPYGRVALKSLLYEGDDKLRLAVQDAIEEMSSREDLLTPPGLG